MAQLVDEQIILEDSMSNKRMDIEGVIAKFGVKPKQIIDFLALMGDKSDNIPGIPNVGGKTAAKWLAQYQTLENIVAHADQITGKIGEQLRNNLDQAPIIETTHDHKQRTTACLCHSGFKTPAHRYRAIKRTLTSVRFFLMAAFARSRSHKFCTD